MFILGGLGCFFMYLFTVAALDTKVTDSLQAGIQTALYESFVWLIFGGLFFFFCFASEFSPRISTVDRV